jgi:hypothetical protein
MHLSRKHSTPIFKYEANLSLKREEVFCSETLVEGSRDSSVGIATGYGLDNRGVGIRVPGEQEFSLLHAVQTGTGNHPTSYPKDNGGSFPWGKAAGA